MPRGVYERKLKPNIKPEDTVTEPTAPEQPEQLTATELEADVQAAAARADLATDGELCGQCWPAGWPGDGDAAECSHGTWTR